MGGRSDTYANYKIRPPWLLEVRTSDSQATNGPIYKGTHQFNLFCTSTIFIYSAFSVLRPLFFDLITSTRVLRPFVKSGLLICGDVQVEVQFWSK